MAFAQAASGLLLRLITAVVIIFIGLIVGKILGRLVEAGLHALGVERFMRRAGVRFYLEPFIARGLEYLVYVATIVIAVSQLRLTNIILYALLGLVLLCVLISVFLSLRDMLPNLLAGLALLRRHTLKPGAKVRVGSLEGTVEQMDVFETRLALGSGEKAFVPNILLAREPLHVKRAKR